MDQRIVDGIIFLLRLTNNEELIVVQKWIDNEAIQRIGRDESSADEAARGIPPD